MERKHIYLFKCIFAVQKDVFLTLKYGKTRWRPGLPATPRNPLGELTTLPRPLVGWGGDTPPQTPPRSTPSILAILDSRTRYSNFAPSALNFGIPIVVNLRNDHCGVTSENITINHTLPRTRFPIPHFCYRQYGSSFKQSVVYAQF